MENTQTIEVTNAMGDGVEIHVIIEHADGSFTSMLKSTYDQRQAQAALSTPNV
jgi:hypothetical protein